MSDFIPKQYNDDSSIISEDSTEPYFDVRTGRIVLAREAWGILAEEGHPRYKHLVSGGDENYDETMESADSVFRTTTAANDDDDPNDIPILATCSSGGGPTQLSIDRALHPDLNDPNKRSTLSPSKHAPKKDTQSDDDDEETDPVIIRAKAMALAARNGQKLTPEQLQLIAQPDVQQQKLIEEAKRIANSRHGQNSNHSGGIINLQQSKQDLQQFGKDIKNFIKTEQGKPPSKWSSDLGKFFEDQALRKSTNSKEVDMEDSKDEPSSSPGSTVGASKTAESPKKKKMKGFGTDPNEKPQPSPTNKGDENAAATGKWPAMPPLPLLNKIYGAEEDDLRQEELRLSGVLWKRRSGFGKHSANAWEKRRVELRGTKLVYYSTAEEVKGNENDDTGEDDDENEGKVSDVNSSPRESSHKKGIIEQAALAAEQQIQTAKDGLSRFASGIDILKPPSEDTPRGILDISKERASVSASLGHSGSPTPFCLSIKVKSLTQWKFSFDSHGTMMEWLAMLTDVVVEASLSVTEAAKEGSWELEKYCVTRKGKELGQDGNFTGEIDKSNNDTDGSASTLDNNLSSGNVLRSVEGYTDDDTWTLSGNKLYIAWVAANGALLLARSSSTSIDQFWKIFVFTNFGIWQLCTRPKVQSPSRRSKSIDLTTDQKSPTLASIDTSIKPMAGSTTIKVQSVVKKEELDLPSWLPISSSIMQVRSHGYLTTKKKIPCPGELYECFAVDCFASDTRCADIAARVELPEIKFDDGESPKTWQSPDLFVVSLAIPAEAPRFGQSTDDGPGGMIVGYFKMKEETRAILRRITAPGYNVSDESESTVDVQKNIVNGVRLWEQYCIQAPSDPSFQARFKLIPSANLTDLGCPSYIVKYNGKPVLIKRNKVTGFFTNHRSLNAMSFEISFHPFPYLFKQAMAYLKDYFDDVIGTFGFVIEGRSDDELPEVMIGVMQLCYPGESRACREEDFFAGKCKKSSVAKKED